jgi:hypothetical protein
MQTPRRQALLATLAGVLAGITLLGLVVVIRGLAGPSDQAALTPPAGSTSGTTPVSGASPDDALDAERLDFTRRSFGSGTVDVPTGWRSEQNSGEQIRYVDPSGTWLFRVDAREQKRKIAHMLASRENSLRRSPDFEVVSRDSGEVDSTGLAHRTLVYTYTNDSGTKRMVMSRWISADDDGRSVLEITVGGRPRDEAGLAALLDRATQNLVLDSA